MSSWQKCFGITNCVIVILYVCNKKTLPLTSGSRAQRDALSLLRKQILNVFERLELNGVARRFEEEHGGLLAWFAFEERAPHQDVPQRYGTSDIPDWVTK
jgi:hypothetical protein